MIEQETNDIHLLRRGNLNGLLDKEHLVVERNGPRRTETEVTRRGKWEYPYVEEISETTIELSRREKKARR